MQFNRLKTSSPITNSSLMSNAALCVFREGVCALLLASQHFLSARQEATKAQCAVAGQPHRHHRLAGKTFAPGDLKGFESVPPSELYKTLKGTSQFEKKRKKYLLAHVIPMWPVLAAHSLSFIVFVSSPGHESTALTAHDGV